MAEVSEDKLVGHWLAKVGEPGVRAELEGIFAEAGRAIAERGPACWASGRCCNFEKAGHLLYVTGLEAAYTIAMLGGGARGDGSTGSGRAPAFAEPKLRLLVLEEARARGGCPFQVGNLCGVHAIKPIGCRVYFCDRSAQEWQRELSERLLERVRGVHERFGVEYRYGEWRGMLGRFVAERD